MCTKFLVRPHYYLTWSFKTEAAIAFLKHFQHLHVHGQNFPRRKWLIMEQPIRYSTILRSMLGTGGKLLYSHISLCCCFGWLWCLVFSFINPLVAFLVSLCFVSKFTVLFFFKLQLLYFLLTNARQSSCHIFSKKKKNITETTLWHSPLRSSGKVTVITVLLHSIISNQS